MSEKKELNSDNLDQVAGGQKLHPTFLDRKSWTFNPKEIKEIEEIMKRAHLFKSMDNNQIPDPPKNSEPSEQ